MFEDVFKFLPNCPSLTRSSRVKRECRFADGTLVPRCHGYVSIDGTTCPNGCDATDTGYDCDVTDFGCHMVIVCRVVVSNRNETYISDNLQYNTVGRWVDGKIVLPSDGPMFIFIDWE